MSLYSNLKEFLSRADFGIKTLAILLLILTVSYLALFTVGHKIKNACLALVPLVFLSLLPFVFYLLTPARGLAHAASTSRAQIAAMYPILLFLYSVLDTERLWNKISTAMKSLWRN